MRFCLNIMKIKLLLFVCTLFVFTNIVVAQSVVITPKRVVYTRKIKDADETRKTFEVRYPVVSRAVSPTVLKELNNTISYWSVFETSLKESMSETYLNSLDYKVNYNKNGVLDISLFSETSAAYPDTHTVNLVIDLKTGKPVTFDDVFASNSEPKLAALVDKKLAAEKTTIVKSIDADRESYTDAESRDSAKQSVNELKFTTENFNEFSVNDKGVTILYDAGFPHVIQALAPDGQYFFSWAAIKPFIRRGGLLEKFVR